jgi:trans-aconitate 2-methyltransferase
MNSKRKLVYNVLKVIVFPLIFLSNLFAVTPDFYDQNSLVQYELAKGVINKEIIIKGNEQILDIGCGNGKLTSEIADKLTTGHIRGIDKSKSMIMFAAENYNHRKEIDFKSISAEKINEIEKYDLVISFSAFHWLDDPELALEKISKALKKGGKAYIHFSPAESADWNNYKNALSMDSRLKKYEKGCIFNNILTLDKCKKVAKDNHLKIIKTELENVYSIHPDLNNYRAYVRGWIQWFAPVPDKYLDLYVDKIVECGKDEFKKDDKENILFPYQTLSLILEKQKN